MEDVEVELLDPSRGGQPRVLLDGETGAERPGPVAQRPGAVAPATGGDGIPGPKRSRNRTGPERLRNERPWDPSVKLRRFSLPEPDRDDAIPDVARFRRAVGNVELTIAQAREVSAFLRTNSWAGTAVTGYGRLLSLTEDSKPERVYGVAFDLGTTTVAATLVRLDRPVESGGSAAACMNSQVSFGHDVITRISRVMDDSDNLARMRSAAVETCNALIEELVSREGISPEAIYDVSVAGNAAMQQILCGMDPSALGCLPFVQAFDGALRGAAGELGLRVHPRARVFVFPQVGGFVGGDTTAGLVGVGFVRRAGTSLYIDIGTNGEIVLKHGEKMLAASTAAGPALEGARIVEGMRGSPGAIEHVRLQDGEVSLGVIGDERPSGICGSGLIEVLSELLTSGILGRNGKLRSPDECGPEVLPALRRRLTQRDGRTVFVLVTAEESATRRPICLWQKDVSELQLAIAAIRAGTETILRKAGVSLADLDEVLLAGGFGSFVQREHALRVGLLPPVEAAKIRSMGNTALQGAKDALLSEEAQREAEELRDAIEHIDLSLDPGFNDLYAEFMVFPEIATPAPAGRP